MITHTHFNAHHLPDKRRFDVNVYLIFYTICHTLSWVNDIILKNHAFYHGFHYIFLHLQLLIWLKQLLHVAVLFKLFYQKGDILRADSELLSNIFSHLSRYQDFMYYIDFGLRG